MSDTPSPLTPADLDLSALEYMPLQIERMKRSVAWIKAKRQPELGFYMINLWTAAFHQTPAASLPNDDDLLSDYAMCEPRRWPKVKDAAMRGFVLCSDGRWYHGFVAQQALDALEKRQRWRKKKQRQREGQGGPVPPDVPGDTEGDIPEDTQGDMGGETPLRDGTGRDVPIDRPSPEDLVVVAREARPPPTPRLVKFSLPEDWQPLESTINTLRAKGYSDHEITWQRDRFVNHFVGGEKRPGWERSFINWVTGDPPGRHDPARNGAGNRQGRTSIVAGVSQLLNSMADDESDRG